MSIAIDSMKCRACGKCLDVCPGSLIVRGEDKKAVIRYRRTAGDAPPVSRSVRFEAISYYLGADIGGMGSQMTVHTEGDLLHWRIKKTDGTIETIVVNKRIRINGKEEDHESIISS